jgi:hypothetical protein
VALVAVAAVLVAVAALAVRAWLPEDYRRYTSDLTVVPFRLDHPADWDSRAGPASDILLGPDPAAATGLFFNKDWTSTAATVRAGSADAVWLYVYSLASPFDTSSPEALEQQLGWLLPPVTQFEPTHRQVAVAGVMADEREAVISNPQDPRTQLRALVDVVQPPGAGGTVLLAFAAPPDSFEDHRPTFERIRDSLVITG